MADTNASGTQGTGLAPNIAALLAYICMPITSVIFMVLEKNNKYVQFHAWQGTIVGVTYIVTMIAINILAMILTAILPILGMVIGLIVPVLGLLVFILWIVCLVKAYSGEEWMIPYIGEIARKKVDEAAAKQA